MFTEFYFKGLISKFGYFLFLKHDFKVREVKVAFPQVGEREQTGSVELAHLFISALLVLEIPLVPFLHQLNQVLFPLYICILIELHLHG